MPDAAWARSLMLKDFSTIGDMSSIGTSIGRSSVGIVSSSSSSMITALFNTEQHDESCDMYDMEPNSGLAGVSIIPPRFEKQDFSSIMIGDSSGKWF
jgi:hypothetical protein